MTGIVIDCSHETAPLPDPLPEDVEAALNRPISHGHTMMNVIEEITLGMTAASIRTMPRVCAVARRHPGFAAWAQRRVRLGGGCAAVRRIVDQIDEDGPTRGTGSPTSAAQTYQAAPLEALPTTLRDLCETVAAHVQVPVELALMTALPALAFATGGGLEVDISGHREPLAIWTMPTAPPSERKTGTIVAVVRRPLRAAVEWFWEGQAERQGRLRDLVDACDGRIKATKSLAGSIKADPQQRAQALHEVAELEAERRSYVEQLVHRPLFDTSDATVEGLEALMAERGGVAASFTDEAALLSTISGRYSKNGAISLGSLNAAWSASAISVQRTTTTRAVERPFMVLAQLVQPEPAARLLGALRGQADGFLSRWLYAELPPYGPRRARGADLDESVVNRWIKALHSIMQRCWAEREPGALHLTEAAWAVYTAVHDEVEQLRVDAVTAGDGVYAEWLGKAANGHVTRVAALFALVEDPETRTVDDDAMRRAVALFGWLRGQAERAMRVTGGEVLTVADERDALAWLARRRAGDRKAGRDPLQWLQARDLQAGIRRYRGADRSEVEAVLSQLEDAGWLNRADPSGRSDAATRWRVRDDFEYQRDSTPLGRSPEPSVAEALAALPC